MIRKVLVSLLFLTACHFLPLSSAVTLNEVSYAASGVMVGDCVGDKDEKDEACQEGTKTAVDQDEKSTAVGVSAWDYVKMIFALIFVVALLYGLLRYIKNRSSKYQHSKMMQSLGGISLGQQKSVQLVKVGEQLYLVGVGEDVQLLKEIKDEDERQSLMAFYNEKQAQPLQGTPIETLVKKFTKKSAPIEETKESNFKQQFAERLNQIKSQRTENLEQLKQKEREKDHE